MATHSHRPVRKLAALTALLFMAALLAPLFALPSASVQANSEVVPVQVHSSGSSRIS